MNGFDELYEQLHAEVAASPQKRVLIVEGSGDVNFLTQMLDKPPLKSLHFHTDWVIGAAGGKSNVLRVLERSPDWFGLIDRDAESEASLQALRNKTPGLFVLPRFCLENYLIQTDELQAALSEMPRCDADKLRTFFEEIKRQAPHAVRHGSLWRAVQPLYDDLMAMGFNGALLRYELPSEEKVREILSNWETLMDAEKIYASYEQYQEQAETMAFSEQMRIWVHGKSFWRGCVLECLDRLQPGRSSTSWQRDILRRMPLPKDLEELLLQMMDAKA